MTAPLPIHRASSLRYALASASLLVGCGGTVLVDRGDTGDGAHCEAESPCGDENDDDAPVVPEPFPEKPGSSARAFSGDHLWIALASQTITCMNPFMSFSGCEPAWEVSLVIPSWMQAPGIYSLEPDSDIDSFASERGPSEGSSECFWVGGNDPGGTVEIVSVSKEEIRFRLEGTWLAQANGLHSALRCD